MSAWIFLKMAAVSSVWRLTSAWAAVVFLPDSKDATIFDNTVALKAATPNTIARTAPIAEVITVVLSEEIPVRMSLLSSKILENASSIRARRPSILTSMVSILALNSSRVMALMAPSSGGWPPLSIFPSPSFWIGVSSQRPYKMSLLDNLTII